MSSQISGSVGMVLPKPEFAPAAPNQTNVQPSSEGDATSPVPAIESIPRTGELDKSNRNQPGISEVVRAEAEDEVERPLPVEANQTSEELEELATEINEKIRRITTSLQFSVDEEYNGVVIKVMDKENDEIIRQIPNADAVALAKFLRELEERGDEAKLAELSHASSRGQLSVEGLLLHARA